MALVIKDRIKETTTTTGTSTYSLAGAESGFQGFSAVGDGNTCYYACTDNTDFEVGIGTFTASGSTLARTTILESSNSDAAVDWSAGTKDIFVTYPADKAVFKDASGNIAITGDVTIEDNKKLHFGDGQDLSIHHYADNWIVSNNGDLHIRQEATDKDVKIQADNANGHAVDYFQADGSTGEVILSHFGYPKIKTKSTGADITGNITVSGTVDGVDIAARDAVLTSTTTTANAAMPTSGGTFTGDVTILNTDGGSGRAPDFNLKRDSASPAAWDYLGAVRFLGEDGGSNETPYASILGRIVDPTSGSEDGRLEIWQQKAGTGTLTYVFEHDAFKLMNEQPIMWQDHHGTTYDVFVEPATPTADRTITLPDETGQVVLSSGAVGTDATALIGRGKIGYCGFSDVISISHEDYGTSNAMGFGQNVNGHTWLNSPSGASPTLRVENNIVLDAKATEIVAHQDIKLDTNKNLVFEGATADGYETTVTVADPTADQTITLPNQTGTAMLWQSLWPDDPNPNGYNTVLGGTAGSDLDATASHNTLIGQNAGLRIVSQDYNTAIGQFAYGDDATASSGNNTAVGYYALSYSSWFQAAGMQYNTSVGAYSGSTNKTGDNNTFVGYNAKNYYNNSSGNVAIGHEAKTGHFYNVSIGVNSGKNMVNQCDNNTMVGAYTGKDLNGSDNNVFIGDRSGYRTTTGSHNTMVGGLTGFYNTLGSYNTYIGERAGNSGYNGDNNTFVGRYAGYDVEGDNNTILGYYA